METSRNRLSRRVSCQSLYSDFGSCGKTGGTGFLNRERLQSIPYLDITLGTSENATFLLRSASIVFIFHWQSSSFGLSIAPAAPVTRLAASRPTVPACRSRSQTAAPLGERTFRSPE